MELRWCLPRSQDYLESTLDHPFLKNPLGKLSLSLILSCTSSPSTLPQQFNPSEIETNLETINTCSSCCIFLFQKKKKAIIQLTAHVITDGRLESRNYGIYTKNEAGKRTLGYWIKLWFQMLLWADWIPVKLSLAYFHDSFGGPWEKAKSEELEHRRESIGLGAKEVWRMNDFRKSWIQLLGLCSSFGSALCLLCGNRMASGSFGLKRYWRKTEIPFLPTSI